MTEAWDGLGVGMAPPAVAARQAESRLGSEAKKGIWERFPPSHPVHPSLGGQGVWWQKEPEIIVALTANQRLRGT